jgi:hypothetical protein
MTALAPPEVLNDTDSIAGFDGLALSSSSQEEDPPGISLSPEDLAGMFAAPEQPSGPVSEEIFGRKKPVPLAVPAPIPLKKARAKKEGSKSAQKKVPKAMPTELKARKFGKIATETVDATVPEVRKTGGNKGALGKCPRNTTTSCLTLDEMIGSIRNKEKTFFGPNAVALHHNAGASFISAAMLPNGTILLQGDPNGRNMLRDPRFAQLWFEYMLPNPNAIECRRLETLEDRKDYMGVMNNFSNTAAMQRFHVPELEEQHQLWIDSYRITPVPVISKVLPPGTPRNEKGRPVGGIKAYEEKQVPEAYLEMHTGLPSDYSDRLKSMRTHIPLEDLKYLEGKRSASSSSSSSDDSSGSGPRVKRAFGLVAELSKMLSDARDIQAVRLAKSPQIPAMHFIHFLPYCLV